jgi:hypothetical protein
MGFIVASIRKIATHVRQTIHQFMEETGSFIIATIHGLQYRTHTHMYTQFMIRVGKWRSEVTRDTRITSQQ